MQNDKRRRIQRADGVTPAERYLKRLCDRTFLSLWSYAGVYRDQGKSGNGDGKEVCDLLVVFENDIVIFSDKYCEFPRTDRPERDWCRWVRRAVFESAQQVWGAERWLKSHSNRLYLDRKCTEPFPLALPDPSKARFHRIVVAHNASQRCRQALGGSGSLMLIPRIVGADHYDTKRGPIKPFAIGQIDPTKGYVHVLDDTTLDILLGKLDTISDFVNYLTKKEQFVTSGRLLAAAGEEELLGHYLGKLNAAGEHDFVFPEAATAIGINEGFWDDFLISPERERQVEADRISYAWDALIEKFASHILGGTSHYNSHPEISEQAVPLRFMARESRTRRRMLAQALLGLLDKTPVRGSSGNMVRANRVLKPLNTNDPYYVFMLLSVPDDKPFEEYRVIRRHLLEKLCMAVKLKFPDAMDVVGLAMEPGREGPKTEDALYMDLRGWTPEMQVEAEKYRDQLSLLKHLEMHQSNVKEYPDPEPQNINRPQSLRNSPCYCGSGRKYKRCCGRAAR